jgi:hypothetical protein
VFFLEGTVGAGSVNEKADIRAHTRSLTGRLPLRWGDTGDSQLPLIQPMSGPLSVGQGY